MHMWQWFCQFNCRSIRFRWLWLVVVITTAAMVVSTVAGALFAWNNQPEQVHLDQLLQRAVLQIGVNLVGPFLLLFFGLRFLDGVVKSIKDLAETSRQIRDDTDFSRRVAPSIANPPGDEVGELVANFNAMLAEIEWRDVELSAVTSGWNAL